MTSLDKEIPDVTGFATLLLKKEKEGHAILWLASCGETQEDTALGLVSKSILTRGGKILQERIFSILVDSEMAVPKALVSLPLVTEPTVGGSTLADVVLGNYEATLDNLMQCRVLLDKGSSYTWEKVLSKQVTECIAESENVVDTFRSFLRGEIDESL